MSHHEHLGRGRHRSAARTRLGAPCATAVLAAAVLSGAASGQAFLGEFGPGVVTSGDRTGFSVAIIGDVNGDGRDDMLIGAPYDDDAGTDTGTVYVVDGYTRAIIRELHGNAVSDHFGWAVARLDDASGDGIDDFVVGAPGVNFNGNDTGGITVYSGATGSPLGSQLGPKAGSFFGEAVAGGGDLNNDGYGDFIVGAPSWDSTGTTENSGWFGVYSGQQVALLFQSPGTNATAGKGSAVAFVGDLNGDGREDYAVGSPDYDIIVLPFNFQNAGRVQVFSGLNNLQLYEVFGGTLSFLGTSVAGAGDTDADGVPEVLAGAPGLSSNSGSAFLYEGTAGTLLHQFFPPVFYTAQDAFGTAVGPLGDVNHDGHDDIIIGAPLFNVTVGSGGYAQAFSGATYGPVGPYGGAVNSPNAGDGVGSALSAHAGDFNGDGWNDILTGWPNSDFASTDSGLVRAYVNILYQPNLNFQGPGISSLTMYGTQLHSGGIADIALDTTGKPNSPVYLIASPIELLAPFKGGVLVPSATPSVILPLTTDALGRVRILNIPGGGGPLIAFMQFMIPDASQPKGWQLSNAVAIELLP